MVSGDGFGGGLTSSIFSFIKPHLPQPHIYQYIFAFPQGSSRKNVLLPEGVPIVTTLAFWKVSVAF